MNKITFAIFFLVANISVMGQQISKQEKLERIKAQKVAFITTRLALTSSEAQQFWPVYNDFFRKKELLNKQKKAVTKELKDNWQNYSDDKKSELLDNLVGFKLKEANLELEYHDELKKVLPINKIIKLYNVESQFKTFLLKQIKGQRAKDINPSSRNFKRK